MKHKQPKPYCEDYYISDLHRTEDCEVCKRLVRVRRRPKPDPPIDKPEEESGYGHGV